MLRIRPATIHDFEPILTLAKLAGIGMSSLPQDGEVLKQKISNAVQSFAGNPKHPKEEIFLFVLEDIEHKKLVGTTAVVAHVGLSRPFYSYKLSTITQASSAVQVYSSEKVLHMVNDYTDATEIGSLFLAPNYRRDGIGKFLSRARFIMLAEFPHLFSPVVISEIRGVQDDEGLSPFYNHLARHFFKMDFKKADYIYATQGAQFIADLMPRYPIYVNLLNAEAQAVIGVPLKASLPAMEILKNEGFRFEGYIDLFDAGPTIQANRESIQTVQASKKIPVVAIREITSADYMISNTRIADFTIVRAACLEEDHGITINRATAEALKVDIGEMVRFSL